MQNDCVCIVVSVLGAAIVQKLPSLSPAKFRPPRARQSEIFVFFSLLPSQSASGSCPNCDDFPGNADEQCVPGPGTTGNLFPGWDRDCGGDGERCPMECTGGSETDPGSGQCEEMRDPETGECIVRAGGDCPLVLFGFLSIFFVVGVAVSSGAMVGDKMQGEKIKLHREQGVEVQARCIKAWTTTSSSGDGNTSTVCHITLVYCVPMPLPTPSEQFYQITKDLHNTSGKERAGAQVMVNHLLAATGDARNVIIVEDMGASQL